MRAIAETDVNLAPLDLTSPFCNAKSELKFFEAAAVGVPTIASAMEPFAAAIEHGVPGFLARDPGEWRDTLELLVASRARRRQVGRGGAGAERADTLQPQRAGAANSGGAAFTGPYSG